MDSIELFKLFLSHIHPLNEKEWEYVLERQQLKHFKKGEILTKQGEVENYIYFITKGIIRMFIETGDKQITFDIHFANSIANAYSSFLTRNPSHFNVQALTELETIRISYTNMQGFLIDIPAGNIIAKKMAENTFLYKAVREIDLLTKSPTERYLNLLKSKPEVVQQVPLNYIASYLGITPQALSRIRKRIS